MKYTVKVEPLEKPRQWRLLEDFETPWITIPAGFEFDGASIPVGLRWLFPHGGAKFPAACLHDYLYRTGLLDKHKADLLFFMVMLDNNENFLKAYAMYNAVVIFGWIPWLNRRRKDGKQ